jgi:hypothetical protein
MEWLEFQIYYYEQEIKKAKRNILNISINLIINISLVLIALKMNNDILLGIIICNLFTTVGFIILTTIELIFTFQNRNLYKRIEYISKDTANEPCPENKPPKSKLQAVEK